LAYLAPNAGLGGNDAFVYFSNLRVVELSPSIYKHAAFTTNPTGNTNPYPDGAGNPISVIVTQGSSLTLTGAACFATAPMSNVWFRGDAGAQVTAVGTPRFAFATNLAGVSATNFADSFTKTISTVGVN